MLLDPPVPGIAVNAERMGTPDSPRARSPVEIARMARHLARLASGARAWFCDGGRLARPTTVLNVNYPARPMAEVRGVAVARQGRSTDLQLRFEPSGPEAYASRRLAPADSSDAADSDVKLLAEGYVTVTPDFRFEVSRRLKEEFENGKTYYAHHGKVIALPGQQDDHPDPALLRWHNDSVYERGAA